MIGVGVSLNDTKRFVWVSEYIHGLLKLYEGEGLGEGSGSGSGFPA